MCDWRQRQLAALVVRALDALVESVDVQAVLLGGMDGLGAQEVGWLCSVGWLGIWLCLCLWGCEDVAFGLLVFPSCC